MERRKFLSEIFKNKSITADATSDIITIVITDVIKIVLANLGPKAVVL